MSTATASTSPLAWSRSASRAASWYRARRSTICRASSTSARICGQAAGQEHQSAGPRLSCPPRRHCLSRRLRRRSGAALRALRSLAAGVLAVVLGWPAGGSGRRGAPRRPGRRSPCCRSQVSGGDEATGRLADGMTEDLITELTRYRALDVIARDATLAYEDKAVDVRKVGQALHVRYILDGAIQRQGERVRISARLVDTDSARDVWSERWDRPTNDVFAVQSRACRDCREQDRWPLFRRDHRRRSRSGEAEAAQQPYRLRPLSARDGVQGQGPPARV